jgi:ribonuclease HII
LDDSKKFKTKSKKQMKRRAELHDEIVAAFPFVRLFTEWVWQDEIDRVGLGRAHVQAFRKVVTAAVEVCPEARVILDGTIKLHNIIHESIPKADGLFQAVSAASVFAKEERDRWMWTDGDSEFPEYDFIHNVGYHSEKHVKALDEHGPCRLHRMSYEPVFKRAGVVPGEAYESVTRRSHLDDVV